jgi:hypothetical protein
VKDPVGKVIREGTYRTKDTILALYDQLTESQRTGQSFTSLLCPAPATLAAAHRWSWRDLPLVLPKEPRVAFGNANLYAQTVLLELLWQSGGELPFPRLRQAARLLAHHHRRELASRAEAIFGNAVRHWEKDAADFFPEDLLRSTLEGYYQTGTLRARMDAEHYVIELVESAHYQHFAHVRVDARLALAVAAALPPDEEPATPEESRVLRTMIHK